MASSAAQSSLSSAQSSQASVSSAIAASVTSVVYSSVRGQTTTVEAPSVNVVTSIVSASAPPPITQFVTSVVTQSASADPGQTGPQTVVVTLVSTPSVVQPTVATSSPRSSSTSAASSTIPVSLQATGHSTASASSGGLSAGGKTAIAVVIPVVVVALLVLAGLFFWRRRRQRKTDAEARRKEVEEYGYNPNHDPTLPTVGTLSDAPEMIEDGSGYRGWSNNGASHRKASTALSGGMLSDSSSPSGGYHSPGSPTAATASDAHSDDPLVHHRRETMSSDEIGALGAAPLAGSNRTDVRRGPSNASSSYSAANRSEHSSEGVQHYTIDPHDYYSEGVYYQAGPYSETSYGGGQQPVVRDVQARRNTRIENPSIFPQQGNSGIALNF